MLVISIPAAYLYYTIHINIETERIKSFGNISGQVLEQSLDNYMMTRDFDALDKTLHDVGSIKPITRIWLINKENIIKISTDKKEVGAKISLTDPGCRSCHDRAQRALFLRPEKIFRWAQPITNKPACYKCHSRAIKYNGVFIIDFSMEKLEETVKKDIFTGFLILVSTLGTIGVVMLVLSKTLVIKRLNAVIDKTRRVREGNYNVRIPLDGDDEITTLEDNFNEMADAINERDKEKDILFEKVSGSQKMWEETFDSIGDLISIHDREFNIIKANRAFYAYFGLDPKELINKKCYDFFHPGGSPPVVCPNLSALNENRPATVEIQDPGTNRIFQISTFPFYYHDARFQGLIHIARDITEEKEKELRLIMSDRLAALGQMASGIAHEINNPLASIAGCAEGLLSRIKTGRFDPVLFENYLRIIEEEISRCKKITTAMLSFVREKAYEKKEVNLNESLDKTLEIIGFQGRLRGIKVIKNYAAAMPIVLASEGELRQAFIAIITNALDAMQDNGELTLETGIEDSAIFIKISDTGAGIPPEHIDRIFTPFFTTKSQKGGTGLGLSIARKIITDNNGNIHVTSEIGKGSAFKITLPL